MADPTTTTDAPKRALADETILFPHQEVKLLNGKHVLIEPWGLAQGKVVIERLDELTPKLFTEDDQGKRVFHGDARALLAAAYDEVIGLVELTVGIDRAELERPVSKGGWAFEDLLRVVDAILEVCLLRSDGGGALPLLVSLVARMTDVVVRSAGPTLARQQSSASASLEPSTKPRANGSGSRSRKKSRRS